MAGVIASVSLHNEKDRTGVRQFANNKSNYVLPEFDKTFQPVKHNIFFIRSVNNRDNKARLDISISGERTTWSWSSRGGLARRSVRGWRRRKRSLLSGVAGSVARSCSWVSS